MPRNIGTGIYTIPPDTEGIPDQTIESVPYNFYIHDVETDLNNPRPVIAGGTGANDAEEALFNLGGEKSAQLVDNYDSWVWVPGSFRSAAGATNAPVSGHAFAGIVYINEPLANPPTNANVTVSARDMNDTVVPSRVYVREKKANVWGPWSIIDASTLTFPPAGGLSATTILEAIQELDAEKASIVYVDGKFAPIASPLFTGDARAPTPITADNDTTIATTSFVYAAIAATGAGAYAPTDALASTGIQINGSMEVQQNFFGTVTTNGGYSSADCWKLGKAGTMGVALGTTSDATIFPLGLRNQLYIDVTTAQASLGGNDYVFAAQPVEGYRIQRLAWGTAGAQAITIGFWSANKVAGIYSVAITGPTMSYAATYTQTAASVYQYNTITIPGPTTGTWIQQVSLGLTIHFTIAAGIAVTAAAANTWYSGQYFAAPGQINGASATNTTVLRISGVVILPGVVAIPAARSALLMRPFGDELLRCQRHYQKINVPDHTYLSVGRSESSTMAYFGIKYSKMRVPPTISFSALADFSILDVGVLPPLTAMNVTNQSDDSARLECYIAGSPPIGTNTSVMLLANKAGAFITLDARL